jgi:hypothetical protein
MRQRAQKTHLPSDRLCQLADPVVDPPKSHDIATSLACMSVKLEAFERAGVLGLADELGIDEETRDPRRYAVDQGGKGLREVVNRDIMMEVEYR